MRPDRWEHGSEFHWLEYAVGGGSDTPRPTYSSGRDALRAIVLHGAQERAWRRVLVPSFLCQEVVAAIASTGVQVACFPDRPDRSWPDPETIRANAGDAVLLVNYFGLRDGSPAGAVRVQGAEVVEDHTHDPWSAAASESIADFCVASLRKTLPLPDGSLLWSPLGHTLPDRPACSEERRRATAAKLSGMLLKALYLDGHAVPKAAFRELALAGEAQIASGDVSASSEIAACLAPVMPAEHWRRARRANFEHLCAALKPLRGARLVLPESTRCTAFSAILIFDSAERRARVREHLIDKCIYPAVLWPLDERVIEGIGEAEQELARRVLSLHCDARYTAADMERVALELIDGAR